MRWRTKAGDEVAARLGEPLTKDLTAQAWRTALDPKGEWIPAVLAAADRRLTEVRRGVPDAGGLVIATDQTRPAPTPTILRGDHRRGARRRALRRRRRERRASRRSPRATSAGWSPCGWCPRASTCRGSRSASTPRRPRRRCSSPRPSAGSCGPGGAARPRRCSCPACPLLLELRRATRGRARPRARPAEAGRRRGRRCGPRRTRCSPRPTAAEADRRTSTSGRSRRWSPRRTFDRVLFDGSEFGTRRRRRVARRSRTSSACRACSSPTRSPPCCASGRRPRRARAARRKADRAGVGPPRARGHRARSSTRSSPPTPARPAPRTPSCTPTCGARCGGPALAQASAEQVTERIETHPPLVRRPPLSRRPRDPRRPGHGPTARVRGTRRR